MTGIQEDIDLNLTPKRNIKYLYNLLQNDFNKEMTLDELTDLLRSDKRLQTTFFNRKSYCSKKQDDSKFTKPKVKIHPCLMYETDEEAYIPQYSMKANDVDVKN